MNLIKINNISIFSYIFLVSSLTFLLWYLFLGFEVINQPFIWDDLHLIRPFTLAEILNSWTGNWESSGIETLSYRPIAILFYNFIGTIFGENIIFLRIFIFLLMIGLIVQFNLILFKLGLNRIQIFIFSILIVFTKIYSTLLSWAVLSGLIFCYILALSSIFLFLKWLDNKENKYYFFSIFFSFLSIFTREEMYVLPGIMVLLLIYKQKKYFMNFNKNLLITLPFFLIVLGHLLLRKVFVPEAAHFNFSLDAIKFGGEVIGFGNLSKSIKASFLPMGYWTSKNFYFLQTLTFFPWILSIIISIIISIKFLKLTNLKSIDTVIFISAIFLLLF